MIQKKITIPEDFVLLFQEAEINFVSRKDVMKELLENDNIQLSNERFDIYQKELEQKGFILGRFKNELEKLYIYPTLEEGQKINDWSLNYTTYELTANIQEKEDL